MGEHELKDRSMKQKGKWERSLQGDRKEKIKEEEKTKGGDIDVQG